MIGYWVISTTWILRYKHYVDYMVTRLYRLSGYSVNAVPTNIRGCGGKITLQHDIS
jgi:hypothetical protein